MVSVLMIAVICTQLARAGIQLGMAGIDHDPSASSILFHTLTHNSAEHFAGNFFGLFAYAGFIGFVSHRVDIGQSNVLFGCGMVAAVTISTSLALFVWPNEGGVAGVSGIVHFLLGYFWIGCFSMYCLSRADQTKLRVLVRVDRLLHEHPFIVPFAMLMLMVLLHWIYDGFESIDPFGVNALGNLYHLVGLIVGVLIGFLSFNRWIKAQAAPAAPG